MNRLILILTACAGLFCAGLRRQFCTWNIAETTAGRHATATTKLADGAFGARHLLVKIGSDDDHVTLGGAFDQPYGITDDQPSAAEVPINVQWLGSAIGTKRFVANGALNDDVDIYTAAGGKVQGEPAVAGTYWKVGRTKQAAQLSSDTLYYVEAVSILPVKVVVIAALTSGQNATTAASDLGTSEALANALKANYNALQADVAALSTALAAPALVKVLT